MNNVVKVTFSKSPPENFLFNLTFPSFTPVEFWNTKVHYSKILVAKHDKNEKGHLLQNIPSWY